MVEKTDQIQGMINQYCRTLAKKLALQKVVLFGSWARKDANAESDVDLIVISSDFEKMPFVKRLEFLSQEWPFYKAADIIGYTPEEYQKFSKKSIVVREAQQEGVTVFEASG